MGIRGKTIATLLFVLSLVGLVWLGYQVAWTGFPARSEPSEGTIAAKTLWDWLELLVVPAALALGAFVLEGSRDRTARAIEDDRQKQQVLDDYFTYLSDLLLNGKLVGEDISPHGKDLARTRTLAALRILDGRRKAELLQFLYEARLIDADPIVDLNGADLSGAELDEASLVGAELRGVYFNRASIRDANLRKIDVRGSDFSDANLADADLRQAKLAQARLDRTNLAGALLEDAELVDAYREKAVLTPEQRQLLSGG